MELYYNKDFRPFAKLVTSCILVTAIEREFEKSKGKEFYMFKEPCYHEYYSRGDSWVEILGFSADEVQTAFSKIGVVYKSKKSLIEKGIDKAFFNEKNEEMPYYSYYDRVAGLTWYFRNDTFLEKYFNKLSKKKKR